MDTRDAKLSQPHVLSLPEGRMSEFTAGTTVLAKQRGFPAWPAVVVDEEDVPEDVLSARPRRRRVAPVLFYGENNYMWANDADLKYLAPEAAQKVARASKTSQKLKAAYKIAANPPHYKDYIASITGSPEPVEEESAASAEPEEELEEPETRQSQRKRRTTAKKAAERAPARPASRASRSNTTRSRQRKNPEPTTKKRKVDPVVAAAALVDDSADEDYQESEEPDDDDEFSEMEVEEEAEEGDSENGKRRGRRKVKKDPLETPEGRLALCRQVRHQFQEALLDTTIPERISELSESLSKVESLAQLEVTYVRQSKINRVLRLVVMLPEIPDDNKTQLRNRCNELLDQWNTAAEPIIRGIPEDLAEPEAIEDPSSQPPSSREVSAAPSEGPHEEKDANSQSIEASDTTEKPDNFSSVPEEKVETENGGNVHDGQNSGAKRELTE